MSDTPEVPVSETSRDPNEGPTSAAAFLIQCAEGYESGDFVAQSEGAKIGARLRAIAASVPVERTAPPSDPWVIWSNEHRAWWRAKSAGYTTAILGAGIYTEAEAHEIEANANRMGGRKNEEAMPMVEALRREGVPAGSVVAHILAASVPERARDGSTPTSGSGFFTPPQHGWSAEVLSVRPSAAPLSAGEPDEIEQVALIASIEAVTSAARSHAEHVIQNHDDAVLLQRDCDTLDAFAAQLRASRDSSSPSAR